MSDGNSTSPLCRIATRFLPKVDRNMPSSKTTFWRARNCLSFGQSRLCPSSSGVSKHTSIFHIRAMLLQHLDNGLPLSDHVRQNYGFEFQAAQQKFQLLSGVGVVSIDDENLFRRK